MTCSGKRLNEVGAILTRVCLIDGGSPSIDAEDFGESRMTSSETFRYCLGQAGGVLLRRSRRTCKLGRLAWGIGAGAHRASAPLAQRFVAPGAIAG